MYRLLMVLGLNDFDAEKKSITWAFRRGGPCNGCCPHQNHYVLCQINHRRILLYYFVISMSKANVQDKAPLKLFVFFFLLFKELKKLT
jgi:hypothetical protein